MPPKTVRRREAPAAAAPAPAIEPAAAAPAAPAPARRIVAADLTPQPPSEPAPRLATDDLLALAGMDPSELAALMEENLQSNRIEPGTRVTGTITRVSRDDIFVDLGGKSEGQLERVELPDAKIGDEVTAYVLEVDEIGVVLSLKLSGDAAAEHLEQARATGIPVEGKVMSRNTGGFEVRVGGARAFCPASQMSRLPEVDPDTYVGQTLNFRVIETGEKTVVSRRVLQEEEAKVKANELWGRIAVGDEFRGIVRNVMPFGAFVDIGGLEGLVPRREISWAGNADPTSVLRPGQAVEVRVLEANLETRKLTLSARNTDDDPWNAVGVEFVTGGIYAGKIVKLETFGAFIELAPGLQGLAHASQLAGVETTVGATLDFRLLGIDTERKRLSLAPAAGGASEKGGERAEKAEKADVMVQGTVTEVLANGVVVRLQDGRTGWLSAREVDLPAGTVLSQRFRTGKAVTARVVSTNGARVDLTQKTEEEDKGWRQAMRQPAARQGSFGTLGDLLSGFKPKK